jgi:hypothetical protein
MQLRFLTFIHFMTFTWIRSHLSWKRQNTFRCVDVMSQPTNANSARLVCLMESNYDFYFHLVSIIFLIKCPRYIDNGHTSVVHNHIWMLRQSVGKGRYMEDRCAHIPITNTSANLPPTHYKIYESCDLSE